MTNQASSEPDLNANDQAADQPVSNDYVAHNYDAINHAIETEIDKRHQLIEFYRSERSHNAAQTFLYLAFAFSVIAATCALVWWLMQQPVSDVVYAPANDNGTVLALNEIAKQEVIDGVEQGFVDTSFTVFHRTLISSGEYVVTGKVYAPGNLTQPEDQYCYLEKNQSGSNLSGVPLAVFENNKLSLETENLNLAALAEKYCRFSRGMPAS